jgi:hypothetical protein
MTPRERFLNTLHFRPCDDRLPMVEWAAWWDQTIQRWKGEGLPRDISWQGSLDHFGLDTLVCLAAVARARECPIAPSHGAGIMSDEVSYERIRPFLFTDSIIEKLKEEARTHKERHERGELSVRLWLDGFFWFPRALFGIEGHIYAFFDHPALMHRINGELADFNLRVVEELFPILKPDMVGFAEDMSYNHGPMLSRRLFDEFLLPYYRRVIPAINARGTKVLIDSDGDITTMIPWMDAAGIQGVYPLERQAGVDIARIRRDHPSFLMLGGYDKMVMSRGERAMRAEFERILPVMRSGGYVPSVDHQTPPGVSLENYRLYVRLFREYAERAAR